MPVLRAKWEAEGLCAELNQEGWVDACVTPDSDAFLHGAKCVIKVLQLDPKVHTLTFDFAFLLFYTCFIKGNALPMKCPLALLLNFSIVHSYELCKCNYINHL